MKKGEIEKNILLAASASSHKTQIPLPSGTTLPGGNSLAPFAEWYRSQDRFGRYRIRKAFAKLRRNGLIEYKRDSKIATLTEKGKEKVLEYKIEDLKVKRNPWNKKWNLVLIDVPNSKRVRRQKFTAKLKKLEFYPLSRGAWISPFEFRKEINFLATALNLKSYISYFEISDLDFEIEVKLKNIFNL